MKYLCSAQSAQEQYKILSESKKRISLTEEETTNIILNFQSFLNLKPLKTDLFRFQRFVFSFYSSIV